MWCVLSNSITALKDSKSVITNHVYPTKIGKLNKAVTKMYAVIDLYE